uniref:Secreted protein n=1 Tax=Micrurus carvalhoi TaxID=3147026 RepID=A0A2H6NJ67_9SAUR
MVTIQELSNWLTLMTVVVAQLRVVDQLPFATFPVSLSQATSMKKPVGKVVNTSINCSYWFPGILYPTELSSPWHSVVCACLHSPGPTAALPAHLHSLVSIGSTHTLNGTQTSSCFLPGTPIYSHLSSNVVLEL